MRKSVIGMVCVAMVASVAQGAFLVEPHVSGLGNANFTYFDGTAVSASIKPNAVGLTATNSVYGGNGTVDDYISSYTPGVDADNLPLALGTVLGDHRIDPANTVTAQAQAASGLVGGTSGLYKVYWTTVPTTNANAAGSLFTITSDGAPIVLNPVDNNTGGTSLGAPAPSGANDAWLLIGTVSLTAGNTYTVTQHANVASFVSQRSAGVMWERIPEPASLALFGLGGLAFLRRRRA